eukprot:4900776-Pyramimonas_sp.AAC.1
MPLAWGSLPGAPGGWADFCPGGAQNPLCPDVAPPTSGQMVHVGPLEDAARGEDADVQRGTCAVARSLATAGTSATAAKLATT